MLHARVVVPTFSVVPSLLLYAIGCAAQIVSLLPIPKMRPFGRAPVLRHSRVRSHQMVCSYRTFSPLPFFPPFIDRNVSTRFTISMFDPLSEGKASMETTNPYAGTHKEILVQEGLSTDALMPREERVVPGTSFVFGKL
jgi:hypothetical protein